jgi:hypothetical protein
MTNNEFGKAYVEWCRFRLMKHYWPRVQQCVAELTNEEVWWREHETNNSIGNLLIHLSGNLQQFVLAGIGGAPDTRNREYEFGARSTESKEPLIRRMETLLLETDRVLAQFDPARLLDPTTVLNRERPFLEVLAIVVEHFALHVGQIMYITKLKTGKELKS